MGERTEAKSSIESSTRHLTDIAHELSRRASPRYIGDQAKETVLNKTYEWKEQIGSSPLALGIIGGTVGALIGRAFAKERRLQSERYGTPDLRYRTVLADSRGYRYGSEAEFTNGPQERGMGEKIADRAQGLTQDLKDKAGDLKDRASDLKDRASDTMANMREHLPSAAEIGDRAEENPMLVALGGLALGAVAALLLPVSRKERQMLEPVKQRAGEAMGSLTEKIGDTANQAREKIAGQQEQPVRDFSQPASPVVTH